MCRLLRNTFYISKIILAKRKTKYLQCTITELLNMQQNYVQYSKLNLDNLEIAEKFIQSNNYLEKLKFQYTNRGIINQKIFDLTINNIINANYDLTLTNDDLLLLLEIFISYTPTIQSSEKLEIFNKFWDYLDTNNLLKKIHFLKAIELFRKQQYPVENFWQLSGAISYKNDIDILEGTIYIACESGNINKATEILNKMKTKQLSITPSMFNALILGNSRQNNISGINSILETMSAAKVEKNLETNFHLIIAYIENDKFDIALKELNETNLNENQILKIITLGATKNNTEIIKKCINLLPLEQLKLRNIPVNFQNVCIELIYNNNMEIAINIIKSFPKPEFKENHDKDTFASVIIHHMVKSKQSTIKIVGFCNYLIESEYNSRAMYIACENSLKFEPESASNYLKEISKKEELRPHYFWPLIIWNFEKNGEIGVLDTIKLMCQLNVEADFDTVSKYILPNITLILKKPENAIRMLGDCGLKSNDILPPLYLYLIIKENLKNVLALIRLYPAKIDIGILVNPIANMIKNIKYTKDFELITKLIAALCSKSQTKNFDFAGQILIELNKNIGFNIFTKLITNMYVNNIRISNMVANILIDQIDLKNENSDIIKIKDTIKKISDKNLDIGEFEMRNTLIPHPRNMSLEQLENHLIELQSKGLNTRGVLRRLLQINVREGKLERALELKNKCDELNVIKSPGMVASTFDLFIKLKVLNEAEKSYNVLTTDFPDFLLDEHKIVDFAALLAINNKIDKAKKLLKLRASSTKISGGEYIQRNLWNLLNNISIASSSSISQDKNSNESYEFLKFINSLGYCDFNNTLLGPCIREFLLKNNIDYAVNLYKDIVEKYKKTPLQQELMTTLLSITNNKNIVDYKISGIHAKQLLNDVITASIKIHGVINTNIPLILALAEAGTENQLRKILIDPEFRFNQQYLLRNCEHLSSSGKIDVLLKLTKASRGLQHIINERELYNILLKSFSKQNDCISAIELFNKLEADNEFKISQEFLKTLIGLLRMNNIDIPNKLALRAQIF